MHRDDLQLVVTGASGFVGSALIRACLKNPLIKVRALVRNADDFARRFAPFDHNRLRVVKGDLQQIPANLFPDTPHVVVHLAVKNLDPKLSGYTKTNVDGCGNVLARCNKHTRGILYNSSLSVLGQGVQTHVSNQAPLKPQTELARSRAQAETLVMRRGVQLGCFAYSLRPRFVLGSGDIFVLPALARLVRSHLFIGNGEQRFSVIDVDDYAQLILQLARRCFLANGDHTDPEQIALNVGYSTPLQFNDLFSVIQQSQSDGAEAPKPRTLPHPALLARLLRLMPNASLRAKATQLQLIGQDHFGDVSETIQRLQTPLLTRNSLDYFKTLVQQNREFL